MSTNNDGKYLENEVEKYINDLKRMEVAIMRLPDSRSARNLLASQNADFILSSQKFGACHLECKSIKGTKLVLKKFRQLPNMKRWAAAGMPGYVLCHFHELDKFCLVNVGDLDPSKATWKLDKAVFGTMASLLGRML